MSRIEPAFFRGRRVGLSAATLSSTAAWAGLALLVVAAPAGAEDGAMILDVTGSMDPSVEAYTTLPMGTHIALADTAEIEFLDLKTCDLVRVGGGTLIIGDDAITHEGGTLIKREPSECPEAFNLGEESTTGGVVLRKMPFE